MPRPGDREPEQMPRGCPGGWALVKLTDALVGEDWSKPEKAPHPLEKQLCPLNRAKLPTHPFRGWLTLNSIKIEIYRDVNELPISVKQQYVFFR